MAPELTEEVRLKMARDKVCLTCPHRFHNWTWNWYRCSANGFDENHVPKLELNGEIGGMLGGPESGCPLGNWDGITVITAEQEAAANTLRREAQAVRFLKRMEPILKRLPNKETDLIAALDEMVNLQNTPGEKRISLHSEFRDAIVAALNRSEK